MYKPTDLASPTGFSIDNTDQYSCYIIITGVFNSLWFTTHIRIYSCCIIVDVSSENQILIIGSLTMISS